MPPRDATASITSGMLSLSLLWVMISITAGRRRSDTFAAPPREPLSPLERPASAWREHRATQPTGDGSADRRIRGVRLPGPMDTPASPGFRGGVGWVFDQPARRHAGAAPGRRALHRPASLPDRKERPSSRWIHRARPSSARRTAPWRTDLPENAGKTGPATDLQSLRQTSSFTSIKVCGPPKRTEPPRLDVLFATSMPTLGRARRHRVTACRDGRFHVESH